MVQVFDILKSYETLSLKNPHHNSGHYTALILALKEPNMNNPQRQLGV
jgi:hypothetical protein